MSSYFRSHPVDTHCPLCRHASPHNEFPDEDLDKASQQPFPFNSRRWFWKENICVFFFSRKQALHASMLHIIHTLQRKQKPTLPLITQDTSIINHLKWILPCNHSGNENPEIIRRHRRSRQIVIRKALSPGVIIQQRRSLV